MKLNYNELSCYQEFWQQNEHLSKQRKDGLNSLANILKQRAKDNGDEIDNVFLLYNISHTTPSFLFQNKSDKKINLLQLIYQCFRLVRQFYLMEQVVGIEPTSSAWKAEVLPLNYTCICCPLTIIDYKCFFYFCQ